jgi:formylglycine-generating enzyme required for sulfatase activity
MTGNVWEWTNSLYGRRLDSPDFGYPFRADDGREDPSAGADVGRVARGGGWFYDGRLACATVRYISFPGGRNRKLGVRLALDTDG